MVNKSDVLIVGGGLAGLTSAIHLSKSGLAVTLIEKNTFPKHKVCGEYVSNEVLPYFESLGLNVRELESVNITRTSLSTISGKQIFGKLPLGGFGVSRYALDKFLYDKAMANGCRMIHDTAVNISFDGNSFTLETATDIFSAEIVIGAYGKRSNLDQALSRDFIQKKSHWLAVKAHYSGDFPNDLVSLHNFKGGYCGVSKVENNTINICYLADYKTFKKYKGITEYQHNVLCRNPVLKSIFTDCQPLFDKPITISQISFAKKKPVENHILMAGDTAGLIHPLCGNGMAMAIHSAKIASELISDYFSKNISRQLLEKHYATAWNRNFRKRMLMGRLLAGILRKEKLSGLVMAGLSRFPFLFSAITKSTHGQPITVNQ